MSDWNESRNICQIGFLKNFEQDYIYQEHYGTMPSQPRKMVINGVTITSRVLHQTGIGLQDVNGADLLYEIEGEKFGLIQYKRSNTRGVRFRVIPAIRVPKGFNPN